MVVDNILTYVRNFNLRLEIVMIFSVMVSKGYSDTKRDIVTQKIALV